MQYFHSLPLPRSRVADSYARFTSPPSRLLGFILPQLTHPEWHDEILIIRNERRRTSNPYGTIVSQIPTRLIILCVLSAPAAFLKHRQTQFHLGSTILCAIRLSEEVISSFISFPSHHLTCLIMMKVCEACARCLIVHDYNTSSKYWDFMFTLEGLIDMHVSYLWRQLSAS